METSPLPTQGRDRSDSGLSSIVSGLERPYVYVLRLTPCGKYTKEDVTVWLNGAVFDAWVLGKETKPKEHYHVVVSTYHDDLKPLVRKFLFRYWPEEERIRGWGNKQYNCTFSLDEQQAVTYAIKDGEYEHHGYDPDWIKECYEKSFQKNSPSTFNVEFQKLKDAFHESAMTLPEFMTQMINLKAKYDQMINVSHIYGYALSALCKRDPFMTSNVVCNFLNKT